MQEEAQRHRYRHVSIFLPAIMPKPGPSAGRADRTSGENWLKRRWLGKESILTKNGARYPEEGKIAFGPSQSATRASEKRLRVLSPEAAQNFNQECRKAAESDTFRTFPRLSYYVDQAMKEKSHNDVDPVKADEKIQFVKTPDGLTKVVFSPDLDETKTVVPIQSTTSQQFHRIEKPKAHSIREVTTRPDPGKGRVLSSRVILPGMATTPLKSTGRRRVRLNGRPSRSNAYRDPSALPMPSSNSKAFPHQAPVTVENRVFGHGYEPLPDSFQASMTVRTNGRNRSYDRGVHVDSVHRSRQLVQGRRSSGSLGCMTGESCQTATSISVLTDAENRRETSSSSFAQRQTTIDSMSPFVNPRFSASPSSLFPQDPASNTTVAAASLCDISQPEVRLSYLNGSCFIPSIPSALKAAVQPNLPPINPTIETPLSMHHEWPQESVATLLNILKSMKTVSVSQVSGEIKFIFHPASHSTGNQTKQ